MAMFLSAFVANLYDITIGSILLGSLIVIGHKIGCKIGDKIATKK